MSEQLTYPQFPVIQFGSFRLLFLMATEAEYGENLKAFFRPVIIGAGSIEAAITTTAVLAEIA